MFDKIREILFKNAEQKVRRAADIEYTRECVLRKFPLLGVTMANLKTVVAPRAGGQTIETAATDGEQVFINPEFFDSINDDQRVFIYAHEVMHVAFNHILRSKGRNHKLWNIATDAVINQMLMAENLPMVEGGVDIADAINKSAEEMYERLLRENQEKQRQRQQSQNQNGNGQPQSGDNGDSDENTQAGHDNHKIWDDAVARDEKKRERQSGEKSTAAPQPKNQSAEKSDDGTQEPQSGDGAHDTNSFTGDDDGRDFTNWSPETDGKYEPGFEQKNRNMRADMAARAMAEINAAKNRAMESQVANSLRTFGDVGRSAAAMDWRRVLKKTLETENDRWSYRRSGADNDYMARVEEIDDEDRSETEVLMDVSGSVSDEFLREFLRQLRPLLKNSKLRVGCFSHRFFPFTEIKNDRDINNYRIPARGNTDWDLAVKSFSRRSDVNKIIFTDGEAPGRMPDASTRNVNVIWLVYGNEEFNPICGRVIRVRPSQIRTNNFMKGMWHNSR